MVSRDMTLPVVDAEHTNLSELGWLVGVHEQANLGNANFYGGAVQVQNPGAFSSDEDTTLTVARVEPRPRKVVWMERHFKHTQTFLPLGGAPYIVVLAPPTETALPQIEKTTAVRFPGHLGFMMRIGTWHEFPFAIEEPTDMVVILRNETNRNLEAKENNEAEGADLEKRNLKARLGVSIGF